MPRYSQVLTERDLTSFLEECDAYQLSNGTCSPSDRKIAKEQLAQLAAYAIPELVQEVRDLRAATLPRATTPAPEGAADAKSGAPVGLLPNTPAAERFIGDIAAKVTGRLRAKADASLASNDAHWSEIERNWSDWMQQGLEALTTPTTCPSVSGCSGCGKEGSPDGAC